MNITIWGKSRKQCIESLLRAYGDEVRILDESPIFNKNMELIGFKFFCKYE